MGHGYVSRTLTPNTDMRNKAKKISGNGTMRMLPLPTTIGYPTESQLLLLGPANTALHKKNKKLSLILSLVLGVDRFHPCRVYSILAYTLFFATTFLFLFIVFFPGPETLE